MHPSIKAFGLACAIAGLVGGASTARAQAHLGVPAKEHVILLSQSDNGTCCQAGLCFRFVRFPIRLLSNGKTETFKIPAGKILVITDVEWNWSNEIHPFINETQLFRLFLGPKTSNDVAKSSAMTDSNSFAAATVALTSGFTVAQGTPVCGFFAFGESGFLANATLGGYLDDIH
jgi:hypothetical protein